MGNIPKNYIRSQFWVTCDKDGTVKEHKNKPIELVNKYISKDLLIRNVLKLELAQMSCVLVVITKDNSFTVLPSQDAVVAKGWYLTQFYSGEILALYFDGVHGFYKPTHADFFMIDFDSYIYDFDRTPLHNPLFPSISNLHR